MKKTLLFAILFFIVRIIFAQEEQCLLKISDIENNTPIVNANVSVFQDSVFVYGATSDKSGTLNIFIDKNKFIKISIRHLNYLPLDTILDLKNTNELLLKLVPVAYQIDEVEIGNSKKYIENKFDRKSYNISKEEISSAISIFDILKKMPGVVVDENGSIKYKGSEAIIQIDNQPSENLYPKLEMIPVKNIANIELIDAAMQTGGSGRGGIININYKKITEKGLSGLATISGNIQKKNIGNNIGSFLNLNYKFKKIKLFSNAKLGVQKMNFLSNEESIFYNNIPRVSQNRNDDNIYNQNFMANMTGVIYQINDKTKISLSAGGYIFKYDNTIHTQFIEENTINKNKNIEYVLTGNNTYNEENLSLNLFFKHFIDSVASYISCNLSHIKKCNINERPILYSFKYINSIILDSTLSHFTRNDINNNYIPATFSLYKKTKKGRIFFNSDNLIDYKNDSDFQNKIEDDLLNESSSIENISRRIHNISIRYGQQMPKFKFDIGFNINIKLLSAKYGTYTDFSNNSSLILNKSYYKILPSVTFVYSLNEQSEIKFTASQTTQLPEISYLLNYTKQSEIYFNELGSPDIIPVDFYATYLSYIYSKETLNFSSELFYNYTNNEIETVYYPVTTLLTLSKPENIAIKSELGVDISTWIKVSDNVSLSMALSVFNSDYDLSKLETIAKDYYPDNYRFEKQQMGYYLKSNIQFKHKKMNFNAFISYYSREITYDGYNYPKLSNSINANYSLFNNKMSISAGINNLINLEHISYTDNLGIEKTRYIYHSYYKPVYFLSIQYVFKKGDRDTKTYIPSRY